MTNFQCFSSQYKDNAPDEYEPEFFHSSSGSFLRRDRLPLVINVGGIKTPSLNMKVKFAGLDSLLFEDLCKVNIASAQNSKDLDRNLNNTARVGLTTPSGLLCARDHSAEESQVDTSVTHHQSTDINDKLKAMAVTTHNEESIDPNIRAIIIFL